METNPNAALSFAVVLGRLLLDAHFDKSRVNTMVLKKLSKSEYLLRGRIGSVLEIKVRMAYNIDNFNSSD